MKFQIITIGKKHDKNLEDFISEFETRIKSDFDLIWTILKSEDDSNKDVQIKKESEKILSLLEKSAVAKAVAGQGKGNNFIILLDENGKQKTNGELAEIFGKKMNEGIGKIIFIIGGAFGVNEEVKEKANLILSLSKLVFPHQLVRAILIEQIYRSISILKNGKYHHE